MPNYRRWDLPGSQVFFTVVTHLRTPILTSDVARNCLRSAFEETRGWRPFQVEALCLLPDHLHCIWTLPEEDGDYAARWRRIKGAFTRLFLAAGGTEGGRRSASRQKRGEAAIWHRRYWEHKLRDEMDFARHVDYIHFNPVKHGLAKWARDWPWSTFERYIQAGLYDREWGVLEPASIAGLDWE